MHFAKDATQAYPNGKPVAGSDGKTFELMDGNFAKESNRIYYYAYTGKGQQNICILPSDKSRLVKDASPDSFKVYPHKMGNADAEDAANKYHEGKKVTAE